MAVTIYYDGDCPFCERYVRLLRLRRAAGSVRLVDVRENADVRGGLEDDGFDLEMPEPLSRLDGPLVHYATIYGTFAAEGAIALMLLTPRLRHWGVVGGILFHLLIALSDYAMYISFTMLSIALHACCSSPIAPCRIWA